MRVIVFVCLLITDIFAINESIVIDFGGLRPYAVTVILRLSEHRSNLDGTACTEVFCVGSLYALKPRL